MNLINREKGFRGLLGIASLDHVLATWLSWMYPREGPEKRHERTRAKQVSR